MEFVGIDVGLLQLKYGSCVSKHTFQMKVGLIGPQNISSPFILELNSSKKPQRKSLSTIQIN